MTIRPPTYDKKVPTIFDEKQADMIRKLLSSLDIFFHPKGGIYIFKPAASLASFGINRALSAVVPDLRTIIDIGANIGQFAVAAARFFPEARIHSFEPVPSCYEQLNRNIRNLPHVKTYNRAVGSGNAKLVFYQNEHSHASSALEVSDYQKENVPATRHVREIEVQSVRLDDFDFGQQLEAPVLLKMDVQGFEKEVLKGASRFLNQVDYILLETSFISMYKNEPLFDEMHAFVKGAGFELMGPVGALDTNGSIVPQMDMLYRKV